MVKLNLFATSLLLLCASVVATAERPHGRDFIRESCAETGHPALCMQYLHSFGSSVRRSKKRLAVAALSVSAARALAASTYVSKQNGDRSVHVSDAGGGAVSDCQQVVSDCVVKLGKARDEIWFMGRRGSRSFKEHYGNAKTWASAALTDLETCLQSLSEDHSPSSLRPSIKAKVLEVSTMTSTALTLLNLIAPSQPAGK